jgi:hypothetical protein
MKIDRFVRVMLVLIALLLALNCVKDLKQHSNSDGSSNNLAALDILQPSSVEAQTSVKWEYVLTKQNISVTDLNTLGEVGWELVDIIESSGQAALKRRKN